MSKESFLSLRTRQIQSGLTIKDFCANESYPVSSFYYWQSKFGLSRSYSIPPSLPDQQLAPIHFSTTGKLGCVSSITSSPISSAISIELPNGVKVHFTDSSSCDTALHFITQLLNNHVLSE